jgi:hypothetical protein
MPHVLTFESPWRAVFISGFFVSTCQIESGAYKIRLGRLQTGAE